ncbi:MAG: hypothetical protein NC400_05135 [Clostridium sp.]|nr:hypothetical protein [Clostridium sp.]
MKNDNDLFYTCSLIEFIGRRQKLKRSDVVSCLGEKTLRRIYKYADVFHCEPIEKTADEFITSCKIDSGDFDNEKKCRYAVPDYWTIGEVYERLIEDVYEEDAIKTLLDVYSSWIDGAISNYNSDFYYQPRDYIRECYREGKVI